jgi:hypothetical protein
VKQQWSLYRIKYYYCGVKLTLYFRRIYIYKYIYIVYKKSFSYIHSWDALHHQLRFEVREMATHHDAESLFSPFFVAGAENLNLDIYI